MTDTDTLRRETPERRHSGADADVIRKKINKGEKPDSKSLDNRV